MSQKLEIQPKEVHSDLFGSRTRSWFIRLPKGMKADDLKDPQIWKLVQQNREKQLMRHDRLYCVAHDETFAVEARVTDANTSAAVIAMIKVISFPERMTPLFSDEKYKVIWTGTGYAVVRREDDTQMGGEFGSEALAIHHLRRQYPLAAQ